MARARILHLHSSFDLGGKEARSVKLMNHFGDLAEHVVLSADANALGARDAIDKNIKVEFPGDAAPSLQGVPGMGRYRQIAKYMKRFNLILSYNWGAMDGVMAHTLLGKTMGLSPLIHHEDGFEADEIERLSRKRNWFRTIALQRSHALVVPSKMLQEIAVKRWHQPFEKVARFPNGVDVKRYSKICQKGSFPGFKKRDGEVVVGTVAGLREVKNIPRLLRAVAAAGDHVKLAIAGDGPQRSNIEALARQLGMEKRLMMPGFVRDPARYIGLFDIFALSSDSEQYPISLIEAMAAGCAVAATDVGDVRSIVDEQSRPYIVPRDDDALAEAIRTLASDPDLRERLGERNRNKAYNEYDEQRMFARYRQLYGSAMGRADFARQD
ncbi:glycosyltransferase [Sphingorhabdus arenilitoris]|uniref:Glycosyltransferase n=1 Tax=Sphingorhabdus arenilitoris TaxID=1490041 RepID=A0ABV8RKC9_9SPHN